MVDGESALGVPASSTDGPSADSPELLPSVGLSVFDCSVVGSGSGSSSSSSGVVYSLRLGRDVVKNSSSTRRIISIQGSGLASGEGIGAVFITCERTIAYASIEDLYIPVTVKIDKETNSRRNIFIL